MNSDSFMLEGNQCGAIFVFFITIEFILSRMFRVGTLGWETLLFHFHFACA